jgi:glycerol uptake facilitator-like aquaporin
MAVGLRPGVTLLEGAACEFILGSLLAFVVLLAGQLKSSSLKLWTPLLATVVAVKVGGEYSGPSLNPGMSDAVRSIQP